MASTQLRGCAGVDTLNSNFQHNKFQMVVALKPWRFLATIEMRFKSVSAREAAGLNLAKTAGARVLGWLPAARGRQPGPAQPRCVAVASHTDVHLRKSATASHRAHAHHAHRQSLAFRDWAAFLRPSAARGALQRRRPPAPPTASPFRH